MSTSRRSAILSKLPRSGWDEFVHHLLTVEGLTPISSDNHFAVRFFSTKTNFIRLISSMSLIDNATKLVIYFQFLSCFAHKFWYNGTFFIVFMLIVARILLFHTYSVLFFAQLADSIWTTTTPATVKVGIRLPTPILKWTIGSLFRVSEVLALFLTVCHFRNCFMPLIYVSGEPNILMSEW